MLLFMKKIILVLILLAAAATAVLFFWGFLNNFYLGLFPVLSETRKEIPTVDIEGFKEKVSSPPPLIVEVRLPDSFLTHEGVLYWTNVQRVNSGLPALTESQELNSSALLKTQDMLFQQYFGHISPQGQAVGDLAKEAGYEFIAIGENLALGDFEDDQILVEGWMASLGHRENILNPQYQEIGVTVLRGQYQGRTTWLAVQHFGKPLSACPQPSEDILVQITKNQDQIEVLYFALTEFEAEIKTIRPKRGPEYNQRVQEYNNLVEQYNALIEETKVLVEEYNVQVKLFNQCAQG